MKADKELFYLYGDGETAFLLGYKLHLTKTEYLILSALSSDKAPLSRTDLENTCFEDLGTGKTTIAVHIFNINKKAKAISGRRLVVTDKSGKYKLVEDI